MKFHYFADFSNTLTNYEILSSSPLRASQLLFLYFSQKLGAFSQNLPFWNLLNLLTAKAATIIKAPSSRLIFPIRPLGPVLSHFI